MENDNEKVIELFSGTVWEAEMIASLLRDANIEAFLKNNLLHCYAISSVTSEEVKVMIFSSDFERAKEIVDNYTLNMGQDPY